MKKYLSLLVIIMVAVGIVFLLRGAPSQPQPQRAHNAAADHLNATYIIEDRPVTLANGHAETAAAPGSVTKTITQYFGNEARGDVSGDGQEDIVFLLTQDGGGSGTFFYAIVALKTADGYRGTNALLLGDRIAPQTTEIRSGMAIVNYADRKQGEPMTTRPSEGVSRYFTVEEGILKEVRYKNDMIELFTPAPLSVVASPLAVAGKARGIWYFEASFPLILTDWDGRIIAESHAAAQDEWMTENFVPFTGTLTFEKPLYGTKGTLILKKDNPSGLPEHDAALEIPVLFE
ncbi:MAG: Gmad2 immunoglobulin-like domain-containing protein [Patescibacteria group bacterium]